MSHSKHQNHSDRLARQIEFMLEIDRLKDISRQNYLMNGKRRENDAEHSWHLAVLAMLLSEYNGDDKIDLLKVIKMILIHDLVEIDAGDTYCYDEKANIDKRDRELKAAERIFQILPEDQAKEFRALWDEFEAVKTAEAKFAASLDRFQPFLLNFHTRGKSWKEHDVSRQQVMTRNQPIDHGAPALWQHVKGLIEEAVGQGWIRE